METVLVNPDRYGKEAAERLKAAGTTEGRFLRVPVSLYEAARQGRLGPMGIIPEDYDPERDWEKGRCCS